VQLYALCDQETLDKKKVSLSQFVTLCNKYNPTIIQYRNKSADITTIKKQLIALRNLYDGFLIVNDAIELVPFCDGLHLGQEDLSHIDSDITVAVEKVRQRIGEEKLFGISTHSKEEIAIANTLALDYIGLGAYRATTTKEVTTVLGEQLDVLASGSKHPVAAIGGITFNDTFKYVTYRVMGSALYEN
jgi:thiamine-phosphate pyrophosphorylase